MGNFIAIFNHDYPKIAIFDKSKSISSFILSNKSWNFQYML